MNLKIIIMHYDVTLSRIIHTLRSPKFMNTKVSDRVDHLINAGYVVERVRHHGSRVGDLHKLKSGELRIAIDAPRGLYRTAWSIIISPFAYMKYLL